MKLNFLGRGSKSKTGTGLTLVITIVLTLAAVFLIIYGGMEPEITVGNDKITIGGMFGTTIEFSEISEVILLEESMTEIGVGTRTNGYGGFGNMYKGHFNSAELGEHMLFVYANSAPTIQVSRFEDGGVYISCKNPEDTLRLYGELYEAFI